MLGNTTSRWNKADEIREQMTAKSTGLPPRSAPDAAANVVKTRNDSLNRYLGPAQARRDARQNADANGLTYDPYRDPTSAFGIPYYLGKNIDNNSWYVSKERDKNGNYIRKSSIYKYTNIDDFMRLPTQLRGDMNFINMGIDNKIGMATSMNPATRNRYFDASEMDLSLKNHPLQSLGGMSAKMAQKLGVPTF